METFFSKLKKENGIVMPLVVALIAITIFLGVTAAYLVNSQTVMGQRHSETETALQIAEAGVNRAIYLLNEHPGFAKNPEIITNMEDFELGNILPRGSFELELIPASMENPVFTIISTGTPGQNPNIQRTIRVEARKRSFTNYVYFSDNDGSSIYWGGEEKCYGPLHTNTTLNIQGTPTFYDTVTYGVGLNIDAGSNPHFLLYPGYWPVKVDPLIMPPNNNSLALVAQSQPGNHYYTGRTSILLKGSVYDVHYWDGSEYIFLENVPLPPNGVIYVAGEEGTGFPMPNKFGNGMGNVFVAGELSGRLTIAAQNNIYITGKNPTEFDYNEADIIPWGGIRYQNTTFDVNYTTGKITVGGTGDDMLGLVANNYIYILCWGWFDKAGEPPPIQRSERPNVSSDDDVTIHAAIFALNKGFGYEPYYMNSEGDYVYNWNAGILIWEPIHQSKNNISIRGSLIQNTRKPVGIFTNPYRGYQKDYAHDPRMRYDTPPYFLEPENAGWEILSWSE